jgi:Protein of unknown function (DUF1565)/Abnormal spindle-like microcephaly-assoc'd, ASPM-SPD-2-Hydin/HYDIN/CFA65/VesB-like, Ig-like domain/Cep192 domain 4
MRGCSDPLCWVLLAVSLVVTGLVGCGGDSFQAAGDPGSDAGQDGMLPESGDEASTDAQPESGGEGGLDAQPDTDAPEPPMLAIEPESYDFPTTSVGQNAPPQDFIVSNEGGQPTVPLGVTLSGTGKKHFSIIDDQCADVVLDPQASCKIVVGFSPSEAGKHDVALEATAGAQAVKAEIHGLSNLPPELTIDPQGATFGNVTVGTSSGPRTFTVRNVGSMTTDPLAVRIEPPTSAYQIAADNCLDATLGENDTCEITVTFEPSAVGQVEAELVVEETFSSVSADLEGTGVDVGGLSIAPTPATLASAVTNTLGSPQAFTVTNTGASALGPVTMSLAGANPGEFQLDPSGCDGTTLVGNGSCVVQVRLYATSAGLKSAELVAEAPGIGAAIASISAQALAPARLIVQPSAQNFGTVGLGMSSNPYTFLVTNAGDTDTGMLLAQLQGTYAHDFSIDPTASTCGAPLAQGASCTFAVVFSPSALGSRAATLQVFSTPGGTAEAQLSGEGGDAQLTIVPGSYDFGINIGALITFTITNNGAVDTGIPQVGVQGGDAGDFSIESNSCTVPLGPGGACNVEVKFLPTSAGTKSSSLEVSASPGGTVVAPLTGSNPGPAALLMAPTSHDFGMVLVGGTATTTFTISNEGGQSTGNLNQAITVGATEFTTGATDCPAALAPGASCTTVVTFLPTKTGPTAGTFEVSATPGGMVSAQLSGAGTTGAALTVSPDSHDFGTVIVGDTTGEVDFTVMNGGGAATGTLSVSVGKPTQYAVTQDNCSNTTLAAGGSCTVRVAFSPTSAGDHATVLTASATPGGSASASLLGVGIQAAQLQLTPTWYDFGAVASGATSVPASFQVTNIGSSTTGTIGALLTGTHAGQFAIQATGSSCIGQALDGGQSCSLDVVFTPNGVGDRNASLEVSASPGGTIAAALVGSGVHPPELAIQPTQFDFQTVAIGQVASATFTVTNAGGAATGVVDVLGFSGSDNAFLVPAASDMCSGNTLAAGANCTFQVTFQPIVGGVYTQAVQVAADPGGQVSATVSGGTPDIYVSTAGIDTNDGRSQTMAVRTITRGLQLAQTDWTVHVASGNYGAGESFPISIPSRVSLVGDSASLPVLSPTISATNPNDLVLMNAAGSVLRYMELQSGSNSATAQRLVGLQGHQTLVDSCSLKCIAINCVAIGITGDNATTVRDTSIDTAGLDSIGIDAGLGTNGSTILNNNFIWGTLPPGGTFLDPSIGVVAGGGEISILNGVISTHSIGVSARSSVKLDMRNVSVLDSLSYGVQVNVGNAGSVDLGTAVDVGYNTFLSGVLNTKVGLSVLSATSIAAVGNTWRANTQGSDSDGHYTSQTMTGPILEQSFNNYSLAPSASVTF